MNADNGPVPPNGSGAARVPLLRQPVFLALLLAALASNVGSWMQGFSEQWLVVQLAGAEAPRWAGRMGFANGFAMLLLMPVAGALGDRFDRRHLLAISQVLLAGIALAMAIFAWSPGGLSLVALVWFAAATGAGLGLMSPVLNSVFPSVVSREDLTSGSGYMSAQFNVSRMIGPMLAAAVLALWGAGANFLLNALSFVGLVVVAFKLPAPVTARAERAGGSYREAWRCCADDPQLRVAMILSLAAGLFAWSYHTFVTVYAVRYLHVQAGGAASLLSAYGLGAIVGALSLARAGGGRAWRLLRTFLGVYGAALVLIGAVPHHLFTLVVASVLGVSHAVFGNLLSVTIQRQAPEAVRSRVTAIYLAAILGTTPLGNLVAGEVAQLIGFNGVRWVLGTQGAVLVGAALWARLRVGDMDASASGAPGRRAAR